MGKISRGILGGFSGKVANVVGSSWKGIAVMKSLPLSVANPRTSGQQTQRNKFSQTVAFASTILAPVVKPLWDRFAQEQSGYNAFISANIDEFDENGLADPNDLTISRGQMEATTPDNVTVTQGSDTVGISFPTSADGPFQSDDDIPYAVAWNADTGDLVGGDGGDQERQDGSMSLTLPNNVGAGDTVHVWLAFRRQDGTVVSDTGHVSDTAN